MQVLIAQSEGSTQANRSCCMQTRTSYKSGIHTACRAKRIEHFVVGINYVVGWRFFLYKLSINCQNHALFLRISDFRIVTNKPRWREYEDYPLLLNYIIKNIIYP